MSQWWLRGPHRFRHAAAVALGCFAVLLAPAAAAASVQIDSQRIVVEGRGARAVIERAPFRISFGGGGGHRPLLREVSGGRAAPSALPESDDPEAFSQELVRERTVYAPLTYLVGEAQRAQWEGALYAGNLLRVRRQGIVHAASAVRRARRVGGGARMVVDTTEPGRTLIVTVSPGRRRTIDVSVRPSSPEGIVSMGDSFEAGPREAFHGFGGRHFGLDQRGHKLYGWVEQENVGGPAFSANLSLLPLLLALNTDLRDTPPIDTSRLPGGLEHYLFPGGPGAAYYVQNQFVSSRNYGFLLRDTELARWRMAYDRPDAWQVLVDGGGGMHYSVVAGRPEKAAATLTSITGRHLLPPPWAQGPTVWRAVQVGTETAASYRAKIESDLAMIARLRPPLSAYAFEGFEAIGREYTRDVIRRLRVLGIHTILYQRSYFADDALLAQRPEDVREAIDRGFVAKRADGSPFINRAGQAVFDFTNPAAVRWWRDRIWAMLDLGADGFMQDFGEQTLDGMRFHDGSTGATMHNRYPVLYHRVTRRVLDGYERRHPDRGRIWMFTRSGFTGSARFEAGNFPGDETSEWGAASGLASLAPDMLNRAIGGAFGYSTDIGGYVDLATGPPGAELFTRWSEWSALTPFFRVHNSVGSSTRMPWDFDQATYRRWVELAALHQRALPYIRRQWRRARRSGVPPTRPLWLVAPGDPQSVREEQEWLLGPDVLVAPVVREGATGRGVRFPPGCWRDPNSGARFAGPSSAEVPAPLGRLPYFFRCGTRPF